jgi:hypothetical protein
MNRDVHPEPSGPWQDPEFAPVRETGGKSLHGPRPALFQASAMTVRTWFPWLLLAALAVGLARDPLVGPILGGVLGILAMTLGIVAGAMVLGMIGSVLFAAGAWIVAGIRRSSRWPDE